MIPPRLKTSLAIALFVLPLTAAGATTPDDPLAGMPEGTYVLPDGALAVPLRADSPEWLTDELQAKVIAASARGLGYDYVNGVEIPVGTQFLFIRPGAWMYAPSWCTMNFIYGSPGAYKIGSAGHCNAVGDPVLLLAAPGVLVHIGKTTTSRDGGIGDDYSITPIEANWQRYVDPDVAVIGGPQGGAHSGSLAWPNPVPVKHFGHGIGVGTGGTPRAGSAIYRTPDGNGFYCHCVVAPGDSGGPVLTAATTLPFGQGLGIVTHLVIIGYYGSVMAGTHLSAVPETIADGDGLPTP